MTGRTSPVRRQSRFPVSWPLLYGNDEFLAEGTALDLTPIGWRIAGSMPVVPRLLVTMRVWVPDKAEPIRIHRATVLWVKGCEFAIEVQEMAPGDRVWVTDFLNEKLGRSWISRSADHERSAQATDTASCREAEETAASSRLY
jgi:hypothetical protein